MIERGLVDRLDVGVDRTGIHEIDKRHRRRRIGDRHRPRPDRLDDEQPPAAGRHFPGQLALDHAIGQIERLAFCGIRANRDEKIAALQERLDVERISRLRPGQVVPRGFDEMRAAKLGMGGNHPARRKAGGIVVVARPTTRAAQCLWTQDQAPGLVRLERTIYQSPQSGLWRIRGHSALLHL